MSNVFRRDGLGVIIAVHGLECRRCSRDRDPVEHPTGKPVPRWMFPPMRPGSRLTASRSRTEPRHPFGLPPPGTPEGVQAFSPGLSEATPRDMSEERPGPGWGPRTRKHTGPPAKTGRVGADPQFLCARCRPHFTKSAPLAENRLTFNHFTHKRVNSPSNGAASGTPHRP